MNHAVYITTALGSCLTLVLVIINYAGKFNTDPVQRQLFMAMLGAALAAVVTDFVGLFFEGMTGAGIQKLLYINISLFLIAQNCTYYMGAVFIDYFANRNTRRLKRAVTCVIIFLVLYTAAVIGNLFFGYFFTISPDNIYTEGKLYFLRLVISYFAIVLISLEILFASKFFKHSQAYLIMLFMVVIGLGAAMDVFIDASSLTWPCFAAAVLYIYFYIIQSDSKVDSLTGIGNRYSFNEFVDKLSRQTVKADYSIVMIDMDKFKEINDTLGHLDGDKALRDVTAIIKGCLRQSDFAARYGGDEFVIAVDAKTDIRRLMERITAAINRQNEKRIRPYQLYISYGYDVFTTNSGRSIYEFLAKIDAMMYKQKEERKSRGLPSAITAEVPIQEGTVNV